MGEKCVGCLLERPVNNVEVGKNWTAKIRDHTQRKKTMVACSYDVDGSPCIPQQGLYTGMFRDSDEDQVSQGQTGEAQSRKTQKE